MLIVFPSCLIQTRHVFVMSPGLPLIYVCVCVCVYVVYEDTNLYNDMGMTQVLQGEGDLWGHFQCPHNLKHL